METGHDRPRRLGRGAEDNEEVRKTYLGET